jgi:hypothetical protein
MYILRDESLRAQYLSPELTFGNVFKIDAIVPI